MPPYCLSEQIEVNQILPDEIYPLSYYAFQIHIYRKVCFHPLSSVLLKFCKTSFLHDTGQIFHPNLSTSIVYRMKPALNKFRSIRFGASWAQSFQVFNPFPGNRKWNSALYRIDSSYLTSVQASLKLDCNGVSVRYKSEVFDEFPG